MFLYTYSSVNLILISHFTLMSYFLGSENIMSRSYANPNRRLHGIFVNLQCEVESPTLL